MQFNKLGKGPYEWSQINKVQRADGQAPKKRLGAQISGLTVDIQSKLHQMKRARDADYGMGSCKKKRGGRGKRLPSKRQGGQINGVRLTGQDREVRN